MIHSYLDLRIAVVDVKWSPQLKIPYSVTMTTTINIPVAVPTGRFTFPEDPDTPLFTFPDAFTRTSTVSAFTMPSLEEAVYENSRMQTGRHSDLPLPEQHVFDTIERSPVRVSFADMSPLESLSPLSSWPSPLTQEPSPISHVTDFTWSTPTTISIPSTPQAPKKE